jgi:hypothetical protein
MNISDQTTTTTNTVQITTEVSLNIEHTIAIHTIMSNQAEVATATIMRDEDELEGALLPVAMAVGGGGGGGGGTGAMPISTFDYDTAIPAEARQQEQVAFSIPTNNTKSAVADDSRSRVKQAQQTGLIAQEEENEAIRRANCKVYAKTYHAERAVQEANQLAHRRDFYGLQVQEEESSPAVNQRAQKEKNEQAANNQNKQEQPKGYNVGGYQVGDYQVATDYEVNDYKMPEYKSVYD